MTFLIRIYCPILLNFVLCSALAQTVEGTFSSPFQRYEIGESFTGTPNQTWHVCAWKGERIHQQILLWADENINELKYEISDLKGNNAVIDADNIQLRFAKYIKGDPEPRSCGGYSFHGVLRQIADGLSHEPVYEIQSNDPLKLWLSIDIPSNASAGSYSGKFTIQSNAQVLDFLMEIEVLAYQLPTAEEQQFHLDLWQFPAQVLTHYNTAHPAKIIELWSDAHFELFESAYQYLARMGQKVITTHIKENALGSPSMVRWIRTTAGNWEYDFSAFEKYVESLTVWGISQQISCFSVVGWNKSTIPFWDEATQRMMDLDAPIGSISFNERWTDFLNHLKPLLESNGWFEKTVLYMDEVPASEMIIVIDLIKGHDMNWKIGLAHGHVLSNDITDNIYDLSGILNVASSDGRENLQTSFYTSCTQTFPNNYVSVENSPAEMVWMGWHAAREDSDGYLRWAFDYWQLADPFDARDGSNTAGDFSMGYRTSNESDLQFMSSIRLEMLHQGIQNFEKIGILRDSFFNQGDTDALEILNNQVDVFSSTSGNNAMSLVTNAQAALQDLVCKTTVSTRSVNKASPFRIFPNPAKGSLHIESLTQTPIQSIQIIDSKGSLVNIHKLTPLTTHFSLNLEGLVTGLYFITIKTNGGKYKHKMVKID